MKIHLLYNPLAGEGGEVTLPKIENFEGAEVVKYDVTTFDGYKSVALVAEPDDLIVICGGDGTINRFVNETAGVDLPCEVFYMAHGTGNDFLRDIEKLDAKEPFSIKKYIAHLPSVTVNGKEFYFLNNVGFGIDGYCCVVGDACKARGEKNINYTAIAIKGLLFHYKPTSATVTVDGVEYKYKKVWLAPTMNGRFYGGGMMAAPSQDRLDPDGRLSVMVFHNGGRLKTLMAFPSIFKGEHINNKKQVAIHTGKDIRVVFDFPSPLQIDGELIEGVTEYHATSRIKAKVNA